MSLAPSPTTAPPSIRPGQVPLAGNGVVCPASSTSGFPLRRAKITDSPSSKARSSATDART